MSHDQHEVDEDVLARIDPRIDLRAWRVPRPNAVDRTAILARALAPSVSSSTRRRVQLVAALAIANVALAVIVAVVVSRIRPEATVVVQAAPGAGPMDVDTQRLIHRLEQEQGDLERKMAELGELRAALEQLAVRVRMCEQTTKHEPPGKQPSHDLPAPVTVHDSSPIPQGCDEVSCVLNNYEGTCCQRFRHHAEAPSLPTSTSSITLPDTLDRDMIMAGLGTVKVRVKACGSRSAIKGGVRVHIVVDPIGHVTDVRVDSAPDEALGACVATAIRDATFAPTQLGASFWYPAVF
jgi:hypothetical protein